VKRQQSIILSSQITNNLPLVASLLAAPHRSSPRRFAPRQMPPEVGWSVSKCSDMSTREPPPFLTPIMVANYETLEHQIAKFIITEDLLDLIFGAHLHREVLNRSQAILKFLAAMGKNALPGTDTSALSLSIKHIFLIWETVKSQGVMESEEIYKLLSSILPYLEETQAQAMLDMMHTSLKGPSLSASASPLQRVGSFCEAVANSKVRPSEERTNDLIHRSAITNNILLALRSSPRSSLRSS